jgi:hypothetical protein
MQKDADIDRKQLPCDLLYSGKNKIDARKMSKKINATPARRSSHKKRKSREEHAEE